MKEKFIEIYNENIKRAGADKLLEYLQTTDFFDAPASTRFHLSRPGGLVEHSIHVYERLKKLYMDNPLEVQFPWMTDVEDETIAICGLLHDVCKIGVYKEEYKNRKTYDPVKVSAAQKKDVKNDALGDFIWEPYIGYTFNDELPYGHGEKSVYIISGFMRLKREEAMAIRWHMGAWDESDNRTVGNAFEKYPLAVLTHMADTAATYFDEAEPHEG